MTFSCEVLSDLLEIAVGFPEIARELSHHIAAIMNWVLSVDAACLLGALGLVTSCVRHFPGPSGPFKSKLENFVLSIWKENLDPTIIEAACHVFSMLPRVGGGGTNGIKHTAAWDSHINRILGSLHDVILQLYQDIETGVDTLDIPQETLPSMPVEDTEPRHTFLLAKQFQTLCKCLAYQISEDFPAVVHMPVDAVLTLMCRTLAINCKILANKTTTEFILLSSFLPSLHTSVLQVLDTLIKRCGSHMVPQGQLINKILVQTLGWTDNCGRDASNSQELPYGVLRAQCYTVLHTWLSSVGAASLIDTNTDKLIQFLVGDIEPKQDNTKLNTSKSTDFESGKKKKKKKKQGVFDVAGQLTGQQKINPLANHQVTCAALTALTSYLQVQGTALKPSVHRDIHSIIVPLLLTVQQNPANPPIPYSCHKSRQWLYRLLLACLLVPHPRWPPPLQCAVKIFSVGLQDRSLEVSSTCREAQIICNSILHPRVPGVSKPLPLADLKDRVPAKNGDLNSSRQTSERVMTSNAMPTELSVAMPTDLSVTREIAVDYLKPTSESEKATVQSEPSQQNLRDTHTRQDKDPIMTGDTVSIEDTRDTSVAMVTDEGDSGEDEADGDSTSDDSEGEEEEDSEKQESSGSDAGRGTKRKMDTNQSEDNTGKVPAQKIKVDELDSNAMLATFVDSLPDSD
ncbi:proline-, glutamic acid- and leucine-rich protein 1-like isoform X2 [Ptychodera flava]